MNCVCFLRLAQYILNKSLNARSFVRVSYIFIRDDDVWVDDAVFLELFEWLKKYNVPVVYGVIPMRLKDRMAQTLRKRKKNHPELLDIVQHGYAHQNYAIDGEGKYEFGASRTYEQQYEDIANGMQIMRRCFGSELTPGFIPPFHAEDKNTMKAVQALGIPLFSARKSVFLPGKKFIDLPAKVWLNGYARNGSPRALDFKSLMGKVSGAFVPGELTGMVYRHHAIRTLSEMKAMKEFFLVLSKWQNQGKIRIVLFSEILSKLPRKGTKRGTVSDFSTGAS